MAKVVNISIIHGNPYREPPLNFPKRLIEIGSFPSVSDFRNSSSFVKAEKILDRLFAKQIFCFYLAYDFDNDTPTKKWSEQAKIKNRLSRLRKRLAKKYSIPELLEQAIQDKINQNPSYYEQSTITDT